MAPGRESHQAVHSSQQLTSSHQQLKVQSSHTRLLKSSPRTPIEFPKVSMSAVCLIYGENTPKNSCSLTRGCLVPTWFHTAALRAAVVGCGVTRSRLTRMSSGGGRLLVIHTPPIQPYYILLYSQVSSQPAPSVWLSKLEQPPPDTALIRRRGADGEKLNVSVGYRRSSRA